jgi:hypothetical protein
MALGPNNQEAQRHESELGSLMDTLVTPMAMAIVESMYIGYQTYCCSGQVHAVPREGDA